MQEISLGDMKSIISSNKKQDPNEVEIKVKGVGEITGDYVKKAFSALDDCIERTKRESLAYAKARDSINRDLELKSQYMNDDELQEEAKIAYAKLYDNIYGVLDENVRDDGSTIRVDRSKISEKDTKQNIPEEIDNNEAQNYTTPTETIYEYDEED